MFLTQSFPMSDSVYREEGLPAQHRRDRVSRRGSVPMVPKHRVCLEIRPSDRIQHWRLTWLAISTILTFSVFPMHGGGTGIRSRFSPPQSLGLTPEVDLPFDQRSRLPYLPIPRDNLTTLDSVSRPKDSSKVPGFRLERVLS